MARLRRFSDLDFRFTAHPSSGDVVKLYDDASIKVAVKHLILTKFYGRPFHPEIGSHVAGLLFEPYSNLTTFGIKDSIKRVIENFESERVSLDTIEVEFSDSDNAYQVQITLSVKGVLESVDVEFLLTRVR